jgi:hypothetical protein
MIGEAEESRTVRSSSVQFPPVIVKMRPMSPDKGDNIPDRTLSPVDCCYRRDVDPSPRFVEGHSIAAQEVEPFSVLVRIRAYSNKGGHGGLLTGIT